MADITPIYRMGPAYQQIADERARQNERYGGAKHDDEHSGLDWIVHVTRHLGKAADEAMHARTDGLRHRLVQVAALCVAAIESIDRRAGGK